ncbi:MAG: hypothetical protein IJ730_01805 [Alphaproteobacteria bacterium]|nr:hypothetical protein [Alphaproteobacteria bacterium]
MNIKERIEHYKNDHLVKLEISWKKRMAIVLHFLFAYFFSYSSDVEAMLVTANGGYEKVMRSNLAAVQSLDIETFYLTIEQMAEILSR